MTPINDHCKELMDRIARSIAEMQQPVHTYEPNNFGHDAGDEDPNAWSNA